MAKKKETQDVWEDVDTDEVDDLWSQIEYLEDKVEILEEKNADLKAQIRELTNKLNKAVDGVR
jgi:chaperonin cofactor prefoldin